MVMNGGAGIGFEVEAGIDGRLEMMVEVNWEVVGGRVVDGVTDAGFGKVLKGDG
jgi:hypothetical protein